MLRVTADSNIFISALNFGGAPDKVLHLARGGEIRLAVSDFILEEVTRVLRDKFEWPEEANLAARTQILGFCERVSPSRRIEAITEDPSDNRILECAVAAGSEYLVTGDRHLLRVGEFEGIRIVSPARFLEIVSQRPAPGM